jgi:frataxin
MLDEEQFRRHADHAVEALKQALIAEEAEGGFEVEENNGVLNVVFEDPAGKFVITPNTPVRQIWISALSTSFKLDWDEATAQFVLKKTGESIQPLMMRLIHQHLES